MEVTININGYIVEKEDPFYEMWFGKPDNMCYASDTFLDEISNLKEGDTLNIDLNTDGGSCDAGIRIYNACKDLQKKGVNVVTFNRGKQHSIGNIVMLGGKIRKAYNSSVGVIHLPYLPTDALWGQMGWTAEDLETIASDLRLEENRILDIYVNETGKDKEELRAIMNQERNLSAQELKDLGFITEIVDGAPQVTAQNKKAFAYVNLVKPKNQKVEKELEQISSKLSGFEILLNKVVNMFKPSAVNMDFTSTDGKKLHVVREEGDMAVGDEATIDDMPDGEITLEDGTYVKVEAGKITEISKEQEESEEVTNLKNQIAEKDAEIANLNAQLEATNETVNQMREEVSTINATFTELKNAVTSYVPQGRQQTQTKSKSTDQVSASAKSETKDLREKLRKI